MKRLPLLASLFLLSWITYVDRAAISSAKDSLTRDLSLTDQQIGLVFSAFALGYALAQIPSGAAADRWGPRRLLTALVAVWSVLTAATGAATQLLPLAAIRFLFGVAEAGAFPEPPAPSTPGCLRTSADLPTASSSPDPVSAQPSHFP